MSFRVSKKTVALAISAIVFIDVWFYCLSTGTEFSLSQIGLTQEEEPAPVFEGGGPISNGRHELLVEPEHPIEHYYESHLPEKESHRREAITTIVDSIIAHAPNVSALNNYAGHPPNQMYNSRPGPIFTADYLNKFLKVDRAHLKELNQQHTNFVHDMETHFSYDFAKREMHYQGDGIVYVGGLGSFNWLVLLSIRHTRHLGSRLPIEVILPLQKDAEEGYCERLATMNATCVILEDFVDVPIKGFQLKGLALLVSSFERVLLLDADNIPAHTPDVLFDEGPFTKHGLIVWPDYWRRATHPVFYDIANIELGRDRVSFGENDREKDDELFPVHDMRNGVPNPSSESGQLLLNKKTHWHTTVLSTYYNFHGPNYYYPLFSQGTLGQGDKETFLCAAVAIKESFYQIKRFVIPFGHFNRDGAFRGGAIGQFDPIQDEVHSQDRKKIKGPRVQFVHSNTPKLNPLALRTGNSLIEREQRKRLYGTGMRKSIGYDMEWVLWVLGSYEGVAL